jgi:hypothetical protein
MLLGTLILAMLASFPSAAGNSPWKDKDWKQWTPEECKKILTDSPWAWQIVTGYSYGPDGNTTLGPTAIIASSLVVRQAHARLNPSENNCLNEKFDDRVVVRFSQTDVINGRIVVGFNPSDLFDSPPDLIVSGRKIPPLPDHRQNSAACLIGAGDDISYPRVINGKPVFKPGKNIIEFQTNVKLGPNDRAYPVQYDTKFRFNTKNMVYKGKPDF